MKTTAHEKGVRVRLADRKLEKLASAENVSGVRRVTKQRMVLDYLLDAKTILRYPFFVADFFSNFLTCRLMCFMAFGPKICLASSSFVMSFGCFDFFGIR